MKKPLEIENHEDLTAYLRETGRVGSKELLQIHTLAGGVSNRTLVLGDDLLCTNPQRIARADRNAGLQRAVAESEPNRYVERGAASLPIGPRCGLESRHFGSQRGYRG